MAKTPRRRPAKAPPTTTPRERAGLVMPISAMGTYEEDHWRRVKAILVAALDMADLDVDLVSVSDAPGLIHANIVSNLFERKIVVCDVSGRNPNVLFELGLRLAFGKAVVIVKDDDTDYLFDIQVLAHLQYRRDLRHDSIEKFKVELAQAVKHTLAEVESGAESAFVRAFTSKNIKPGALKTEEIPQMEYLVSAVQKIEKSLEKNLRPVEPPSMQRSRSGGREFSKTISRDSERLPEEKLEMLHFLAVEVEKKSGVVDVYAEAKKIAAEFLGKDASEVERARLAKDLSDYGMKILEGMQLADL